MAVPSIRLEVLTFFMPKVCQWVSENGYVDAAYAALCLL